MLARLIRELGYKVRIKFGESAPGRQAIDAHSSLYEGRIDMVIPDNADPWDWDEATAALSHEYGHVFNYTTSEREAWSNADKLLSRWPELRPESFDRVRKSDLAAYKAMEKYSYTR